MSRGSQIYVLEINRSSNPRRPMMSFYAKGVNPLLINLKDIVAWSIRRYTFVGLSKSKKIERHFIAFQRLWKLYNIFLNTVRSMRYIRLREMTGARIRFKMPSLEELYG